MESIHISVGTGCDYALLDSGNRQKLERIGDLTIIRAEPRAWWRPTLGEDEWRKASLVYERASAQGGEEGGSWEGAMPEDFIVKVLDLKAQIKFTPNSKHFGLFPEQAEQWRWIERKLTTNNTQSIRKYKVLNLFGYTGLASLAAAKAGAEVTHVDASRAAIGWARENQALSGLEGAPIRWILDDALAYVKREIKRGVKYDAIIMDPPAYGRGPKGEVWKAEREVPALLDLARQVLSENPLFVILNMYSTELSALSLENLLAGMMRGLGGTLQATELALKEEGSGRMLPLSISATWEK